MGKVIVGMTTSVDGFVNDRHGSIERLYPDLAALRKTKLLQDAIANTGAVVMGRRAYELANGDFTGYEFQVPIFVLTHHPPAEVPRGANDRLSFTFVTEGIETAIRQAKNAAGRQDVTIIGGASTARQAIASGLVDELELGIVPILFGEGLRFFEEGDEVQLEKIEVLESPGRTDIKFRVVK